MSKTIYSVWKCKHCEKSFESYSTSQKGNHSRWCKSNPRYKEIVAKSVQSGRRQADTKYGSFKEYVVKCVTCSSDITIKEREKLFPSKDKYHCSRSCANSNGGIAKRNKLYKKGLLSYQAIGRLFHMKQCIVCGFDKIVHFHHIDENNKNNDPNNLVPLCPNHHQMVHSRFYDEVKPFIEEYVKTPKQVRVGL